MSDIAASHEAAIMAHEGVPAAPARVTKGAARSYSSLALTLTLLALTLFGAYALLPLWPPLVLAAWVAALGSNSLKRFAHTESTKRHIAAVMTTALVLAVLVPLAFVIVSLSAAGFEFARGLLQFEDWRTALRVVTSGNGSNGEGGVAPSLRHLGAEHFVQLFREYGQGAVAAVGAVAGATTDAVIGSIVFLLGTYTFLVSGKRAYAWFVKRAVLAPEHCHRLAAAFVETGRGLLIGVSLTALLQGVIAGIGYAALGIPRPLVLGFLTALSALIPSFGTALIWIPVSVGLWLSDRPGAAIVMLAIGFSVSVSDNLVRPWLSRYGHLRLPAYVVFIAMLGGLAAFGPWGLFLGPLAVRLAVEGLDIAKETFSEPAGQTKASAARTAAPQ